VAGYKLMLLSLWHVGGSLIPVTWKVLEYHQCTHAVFDHKPLQTELALSYKISRWLFALADTGHSQGCE
jgi:hypothetical protein